jgi:hypothetical protein
MSAPRRRIVRPASPTDPAAQWRQRRVQRLGGWLVEDRAALDRWMSRLKRSFHGVEELQQRVARLDRQVASVEKQ